MRKPDTLNLNIFIDALGWEILQKNNFLSQIAPHRKKIETVFGYSSTCDPTILTGVSPREHDHFTFYTYDPKNSPFKYYRVLSIFPKFLMNRGRVRNKLSQIVNKLHGFTGYFQLYNMPFHWLHLFDYTEQKNIFEPNGINGKQDTIFDTLRDNNINYCRPKGYDEEQSFAEVHDAIKDSEVEFVYLFLGKLDAILHQYGTDAPEVAEHLKWYESKIQQLMEFAEKQYANVHLSIFSDHGMADIFASVDVQQIIKTQCPDLKYNKDYVGIYDSTMARFWFFNDQARERVHRVLNDIETGDILSDTELEALECNFKNNRYGETIFLMKPGHLIVPSHMGEKPLKGMHGYHPDDKTSAAALLSNANISKNVNRLRDLRDYMESNLQLVDFEIAG